MATTILQTETNVKLHEQRGFKGGRHPWTTDDDLALRRAVWAILEEGGIISNPGGGTGGTATELSYLQRGANPGEVPTWDAGQQRYVPQPGRNGMLKLASYTAMGAYAGAEEIALVTDKNTYGHFYKLPAGDPAVVDGGVVVAGAGGTKWARVMEGAEVLITWFGAKMNGLSNNFDNSAAINAAIRYCRRTGATCRTPSHKLPSTNVYAAGYSCRKSINMGKEANDLPLHFIGGGMSSRLWFHLDESEPCIVGYNMGSSIIQNLAAQALEDGIHTCVMYLFETEDYASNILTMKNCYLFDKDASNRSNGCLMVSCTDQLHLDRCTFWCEQGHSGKALYLFDEQLPEDNCPSTLGSKFATPVKYDNDLTYITGYDCSFVGTQHCVYIRNWIRVDLPNAYMALVGDGPRETRSCVKMKQTNLFSHPNHSFMNLRTEDQRTVNGTEPTRQNFVVFENGSTVNNLRVSGDLTGSVGGGVFSGTGVYYNVEFNGTYSELSLLKNCGPIRGGRFFASSASIESIGTFYNDPVNGPASAASSNITFGGAFGHRDAILQQFPDIQGLTILEPRNSRGATKNAAGQGLAAVMPQRMLFPRYDGPTGMRYGGYSSDSGGINGAYNTPGSMQTIFTYPLNTAVFAWNANSSNYISYPMADLELNFSLAAGWASGDTMEIRGVQGTNSTVFATVTGLTGTGEGVATFKLRIQRNADAWLFGSTSLELNRRTAGTPVKSGRQISVHSVFDFKTPNAQPAANSGVPNQTIVDPINIEVRINSATANPVTWFNRVLLA